MNNSEIGIQFVYCDRCMCAAHLYCIGLKQECYEQNGIMYFTCDLCKYNQRDSIKCIICNQSNGIMKKIHSNQYCHITCALFGDIVQVKNFHSMTLTQTKSIESNSNYCAICQTNNAFIRCQVDQQQKYIHIRCGLEQRCKTELGLEEIPYQIDFYFRKENQYIGYEFVIDNLNQVKNNSILQSLKNISQNTFLELQNFFSENLYENYYQQQLMQLTIQKNQISTNHVNNNIKFGGTIDIIFSQQNKEPEYCFCRPQKEEKTMIYCDWCENWFHYSCVQITATQAQKFVSFYCRFCKIWQQARRNVMQKQYKKLCDNQQIQMEDFEFELQKFHPIDLICISTYFQTILDGSQIDKTKIIQLISIMSGLNLDYSEMLKESVAQHLTRESLKNILHNMDQNVIISSCLEKCDVYQLQLQNIVEWIFVINDDHYQKMHKLYEFFLQSKDYLKETGLNIQINLVSIQKVKWLVEFYDIWMPFFQKKTISVKKGQQYMMTFYEQGTLLFQDEYQEILFLKKVLDIFQLQNQSLQQLEYVQQLPHLDNYEKLKINLMQFLPIDCTQIIDFLNDSFEQLQEWIRIYNQKPYSVHQIKDLQEQIKNLKFQCPEMIQLINICQLYDQFQTKNNLIQTQFFKDNGIFNLLMKNIYKQSNIYIYFQYHKYILKNLNVFSKNLILFNKHNIIIKYDNIYFESKQIYTESNKCQIEYDDMKKMIDQARNDLIDIDLAEEIVQIENKIQISDEIISKVLKALSLKMDHNAYNKIKKDLDQTNLHFPELDSFNYKFNLYKELHSITHSKKVEVEKLKEMLEQAQNENMEEKLINDLKQKIQISNQIQQQCKILIQKNYIDEDDDLRAQNILNEIKQKKISLQIEQQQLQNIIQTINWIGKAYKIIEQKQKIDEDMSDNDMQYSKTLIDKQIEKCSKSDNFIQNQKEIEKLVIEGQDIIFTDIRIQSIYRSFAQFIWFQKATQFQENSQSLDLLKLIIVEAEKLSIDVQQPIYQQLQQKYKIVEKFLQKFSESIQDDDWIFEQLNSENLDSVKNQIAELQDQYKSINIILSNYEQRITKIQFWQNWFGESLNLMKKIELQHIISLQQLEQAVNQALKLKIPEKFLLFQKLQQIVMQSQKAEEILSVYEKKKQNYLQQRVVNISKRSQMIAINKLKPLYSEATATIDQFSENLLLQSRIQSVKEDVQKSDVIYDEIQNFLKEQQNASQQKLQQLVTMLCQDCPLRDEILENNLLLFEAKFHAIQLLQGKESGTQERWIGLFQYLNELTKDSNQDWQFKMKEQIDLSNNIKQLVKTIQSSEQKLKNYDKFNSLSEDRMNCLRYENLIKAYSQEIKIKDNDSQQILNKMVQKSDEALVLFNQIYQKDKMTLQDAQRCLQQLRNIPIYFETQEKSLEKDIQFYENLQESIEKSKKFLYFTNPVQKISEKLIVLISDQYGKCKIFSQEANKLIILLQKSNHDLNEIYLNLQNKRQQNLSYDYIYQLQNRFEGISVNLGEKYDECSLMLWQQKIVYLQKVMKQQEQKISYKQIKGKIILSDE